MAVSSPQRKSPAQKGELVVTFIPEYAHYKVSGKANAPVPDSLSGTYTSKKWAEQAILLHFKKK